MELFGFSDVLLKSFLEYGQGMVGYFTQIFQDIVVLARRQIDAVGLWPIIPVIVRLMNDLAPAVEDRKGDGVCGLSAKGELEPVVLTVTVRGDDSGRFKGEGRLNDLLRDGRASIGGRQSDGVGTCPLNRYAG